MVIKRVSDALPVGEEHEVWFKSPKSGKSLVRYYYRASESLVFTAVRRSVDHCRGLRNIWLRKNGFSVPDDRRTFRRRDGRRFRVGHKERELLAFLARWATPSDYSWPTRNLASNRIVHSLHRKGLIVKPWYSREAKSLTAKLSMKGWRYCQAHNLYWSES